VTQLGSPSKWSKRIAALGVLSLPLSLVVAAASGSPANSLGTIRVGGSPTAIAADSATDTIYVVVTKTNGQPAGPASVTTLPPPAELAVIDGKTSKVTSNISLVGAPAGIAVDSSTDRVYLANDDPSTLTVIDGRTDTVATTVKTRLHSTRCGRRTREQCHLHAE
jgi:DNA-binding beta-propeller fold protein YncE